MDMADRKDPAGNHLPPRMAHKHGAYFYVVKTGPERRQTWKHLGDSYAEAIRQWGHLIGVSSNAYTVGQAVESYIIERAPELSPKTVTGYRSDQTAINEWAGPVLLPELDRLDVKRWHRAGKATPVAANRRLALLRAALNYAVSEGWLDANPTLAVRRHTERPRTRVASAEEHRALAAAATPLWRAIMAVGVLTGMDLQHIRLLRRSQLTEAGIELTRSKTGAEVTIEWSEPLRAAVELAKASTKTASIYVFPSRKGGPYTDSGFKTVWRRLRESAGVEGLQFRDLRRTAATNHETLDAARDLLGHASSAITARVYRPRRTARPSRWTIGEKVDREN